MDNIRIQSSLINCAINAKIKKFIFLGSSCIYPKLALQPIKEEYLLTGPLESTNQWYAIAKIAGVKMCESVSRQFGYNYVSLMPTNLYGPGDNFDLESSHVIPAMIRKIYNAKKNGGPVILWGTGSPYREFLHVNDLSNAICTVLLSTPKEGLFNVGTGVDITIKELAQLISQVIGYTGDIKWDGSKPDGTPRKVLNIEKISNLGWASSINLKDGLTSTYQWFLENESNLRTLNFSN
jgi:GDP-L-fucose synthase